MNVKFSLQEDLTAGVGCFFYVMSCCNNIKVRRVGYVTSSAFPGCLQKKSSRSPLQSCTQGTTILLKTRSSF